MRERDLDRSRDGCLFVDEELGDRQPREAEEEDRSLDRDTGLSSWRQVVDVIEVSLGEIQGLRRRPALLQSRDALDDRAEDVRSDGSNGRWVDGQGPRDGFTLNHLESGFDQFEQRLQLAGRSHERCSHRQVDHDRGWSVVSVMLDRERPDDALKDRQLVVDAGSHGALEKALVARDDAGNAGAAKNSASCRI